MGRGGSAACHYGASNRVPASSPCTRVLWLWPRSETHARPLAQSCRCLALKPTHSGGTGLGVPLKGPLGHSGGLRSLGHTRAQQHPKDPPGGSRADRRRQWPGQRRRGRNGGARGSAGRGRSGGAG